MYMYGFESWKYSFKYEKSSFSLCLYDKVAINMYCKIVLNDI